MMVKLNAHEMGLKSTDIEKINTIFFRHKEIESAVIYGSRAKGNFKPYSDIDITLIGSTIDLTIQNRIENELDDLLLPYKIDLTLFHKIENGELIEHIHRVGKVIFSASHTDKEWEG